MIKLSDVRGEKALELTADLLAPIEDILSDEETVKFLKDKHSKLETVAYLLRNCKKPVIEILALLNDSTPEAYAQEMTVASLPAVLLNVLNDRELLALFSVQL